MRVLIAGPVKVKAGRTARLTVKCPNDVNNAFIEVFSQLDEDEEPSPHIPSHQMAVLHEGRPILVTPANFKLNRLAGSGKRVVEINTNHNRRFFLYQQVDTAKDPKVKGRIVSYGKGRIGKQIAAARRWLCGAFGYR